MDDDPHAESGVPGTYSPGAETDPLGLGPMPVGLASGWVNDPASSPAGSSESPFKTVEANITADPANNAPSVRAVGLHELGGADE